MNLATFAETVAGRSLDDLFPQEVLHDDQPRLDWLDKRRGRITGSNFGKIWNKGRSNATFTDSGLSYLAGVVAERLGSTLPEVSSRAIDWGTANEPDAIKGYENLKGVEVDKTPFNFHTLGPSVGATPDALVGENGCIEVKCPDPTQHAKILISGLVPTALKQPYRQQCIGHMLCTDRQWCDFVSFDPRIDGPERLVVIRIERDENEIDYLKERLELAVRHVERCVEIARGRVRA